MPSGEIDIIAGYVFEDGELLTLDKLNQLSQLLLRAKAGSITARELANGSITVDKLAIGLESSLSLADGAVTTAKLAPTAVTAAKMADGAVTAIKLDASAISGQAAVAVAKAASRMLIWDTDTGTLKYITIGNLHPSGSIVQSIYVEEGTCANIPALIPYDDTIPQVTEGNEIAVATITPKYSNSKIRITFTGIGDTNPDDTLTVALFRDGGTSAIAAAAVRTQNDPCQIVLRYQDAPATTSEVTYSIRAGANNGGSNAAFNGMASPSRRLGGVAKNVLTLEEVRA